MPELSYGRRSQDVPPPGSTPVDPSRMIRNFLGIVLLLMSSCSFQVTTRTVRTHGTGGGTGFRLGVRPKSLDKRPILC